MADKSKIEWCEATWNVITGCSVVSPGCTNCYAMRLAGTRLRNHPSRIGLTQESKKGPVWNGQVRFNEEWLDQPLRWKRPRRVFVVAHGDLFHEGVPDEWLVRVFAVMETCRHHIFQVLTKRPERAARFISAAAQAVRTTCINGVGRGYRSGLVWPLPNVWIGTSVEDQARADERIPHLLATPAAVRWVSYEPALGPVNFPWLQYGLLDKTVYNILAWIVVGGESGPNARPMHPEWVRSVRDQCQAARVAFFFKQWGAYRPYRESEPTNVITEVQPDGRRWATDIMNPTGALMVEVGKKAAGRLLDGREWDEYPVDA